MLHKTHTSNFYLVGFVHAREHRSTCNPTQTFSWVSIVGASND